MSILFGIRSHDPASISRADVTELARRTERYADNETDIVMQHGCAFGAQTYLTHPRGSIGSLIAADVFGNTVSIDGRLDNYEELCHLLSLPAAITSDAQVVLRAFTELATDCFARFVGDWAIVIWCAHTEMLYLARDHAGTRTLYYRPEVQRVLWGTELETLLGDQTCPPLNESYAVAFLSNQLTHLTTPYANVHVVPPAHYIAIDICGRHVTLPHWKWAVRESLEYPSDEAYEEHFRALFQQSVMRRIEPGSGQIVAELSGGMDSSSIVCMSDLVRRTGAQSAADLLPTISYFDSTETDWDELPFVRRIEESRNQVGHHLSFPLFDREFLPSRTPALHPGQNSVTSRNYAELEEILTSLDARVILSGLGGDELLGGVPTGVPEIADNLCRGDIPDFLQQAFAWCLPNHTPLLTMTRDTLEYLSQLYLHSGSYGETLPPGATALFREHLERHRAAVDFTRRGALILPSHRENGLVWWRILETLPHQRQRPFSRREYRYPYLDRDLVDFLLRVPRRRLLKPRRRRSMMRNAMRGIVPEEILERKRKGFRSKALLPFVEGGAQRLESLLHSSYLAQRGLLDTKRLERALDGLFRMDSQGVAPMIRIILFELWIRETAQRTEVGWSGQ